MERIREYPTSIAEDKRLLQSKEPPQDQNLQNVIVLRRGEKEVLSFYQTMSRKMVKVLSNEGRRGDLSAYSYYL